MQHTDKYTPAVFLFCVQHTRSVCHKPDIHRFGGRTDVVLLHPLRRCHRLGAHVDLRPGAVIRLIQIPVDHAEHLPQFLLPGQIDQHIGRLIVTLPHTHNILIGQVKQLGQPAAGIIGDRTIPIQIAIHLVGHKIQRILLGFQTVQLQFTENDPVIPCFAILIFHADPLLLENIRLFPQPGKQHAAHVNIGQIIIILLIRRAEYIRCMILAGVSVQRLRHRTVAQNVHQVIERILLAAAQQRMLQHMVCTFAVLRRGTEADCKIARRRIIL